jgi:cell division protein FtsL
MSAITASWKSAPRLVFPIVGVGAVILILAAIAIPNLLRARLAANESARVATAARMYEVTRPHESVLPGAPAVSLSNAGNVVEEKLATPATAPQATSAVADRKIVRTGALELTVNSPADAAEQIRLMAERVGGYLEAAQIGGTKEAPVANITLRIPAARYEEVKAGIHKLAARVESERTDAQDVTRQYVDMEARLRNLRAEEAQYLVIMKSAYKVDDLLEVSQKLSEVRGQIEQQQAEFQALSKQVETVAITISMRALADTQVFGLNWRPLYRLKVAARDGLEAMADYASTMAAVLFYVPVVLAWSLTILISAVAGWRIFRWTRRRYFDWPAVTEQKVSSSI